MHAWISTLMHYTYMHKYTHTVYMHTYNIDNDYNINSYSRKQERNRMIMLITANN